MASEATFNITLQDVHFDVSINDNIVTSEIGDDPVINVTIAQMTGGYLSPVSNITVINLVDQATLQTNAALGNQFNVTIAGDRILGNPTGGIPGQKVVWRIKQDNTGSHVLTLDSKFRLGANIPAVTLSTTPNAVDYIGAIYDAIDDRWDIVAFSRQF